MSAESDVLMQQFRQAVYERLASPGAGRKLSPAGSIEQRLILFKNWQSELKAKGEVENLAPDLVRHWVVADVTAYRATPTDRQDLAAGDIADNMSSSPAYAEVLRAVDAKVFEQVNVYAAANAKKEANKLERDVQFAAEYRAELAAKGASELVKAAAVGLGAAYADDADSRNRENAVARSMEEAAYAKLAAVDARQARAAVEAERAKIVSDGQLQSSIRFDEKKHQAAVDAAARPGPAVNRVLRSDELLEDTPAGQQRREALLPSDWTGEIVIESARDPRGGQVQVLAERKDGARAVRLALLDAEQAKTLAALYEAIAKRWLAPARQQENGFGPGPDVDRDRPPQEPADPEKMISKVLENATYKTRANGSVLYLINNRPAFVDHGEQILMEPKAHDDEEAILAAVLLAKEKYHGAFEITGTDTFKRRTIEILLKHEIDVKLKSPQQEALRRELLQARDAAGSAPAAAPEADALTPQPRIGKPASDTPETSGSVDLAKQGEGTPVSGDTTAVEATHVVGSAADGAERAVQSTPTDGPGEPNGLTGDVAAAASEAQILAIIDRHIEALNRARADLAEDSYASSNEASRAIAMLHLVREQVEDGVREIRLFRESEEDPSDDEYEAQAHTGALLNLGAAFRELESKGVVVLHELREETTPFADAFAAAGDSVDQARHRQIRDWLDTKDGRAALDTVMDRIYEQQPQPGTAFAVMPAKTVFADMYGNVHEKLDDTRAVLLRASEGHPHAENSVVEISATQEFDVLRPTGQVPADTAAPVDAGEAHRAPQPGPRAADLIRVNAHDWWEVQRAAIHFWAKSDAELQADLAQLGSEPARNVIYWFDRAGRPSPPPVKEYWVEFAGRFLTKEQIEHIGEDPSKYWDADDLREAQRAEYAELAAEEAAAAASVGSSADTKAESPGPDSHMVEDLARWQDEAPALIAGPDEELRVRDAMGNSGNRAAVELNLNLKELAMTVANEGNDQDPKLILRGVRKLDNDQFDTTVLLFKGKGDYLQGYVKVGDQKHQVIAHLNQRKPDPETGEVKPNFLKLSEAHTVGDDTKWKEIGFGNAVNRRQDGKPVYFDEVLFSIGNEVVKARVTKHVDADLHRQLGFLEGRKARAKESSAPAEDASPKSSAPAAKQQEGAAGARNASRNGAARGDGGETAAAAAVAGAASTAKSSRPRARARA